MSPMYLLGFVHDEQPVEALPKDPTLVNQLANFKDFEESS